MRKFKFLGTLLLAGLLTVNTFAITLTAEQQKAILTQQQELGNKYNSRYEKANCIASIHVTCLDRFNNLLAVREKNKGGQGISLTYCWTEEKPLKELEVHQTLLRADYKPYELNFKTEVVEGTEHYQTTATLEPTKIINTVLGAVTLLGDISTENLYIQLLDSNGESTAYIKIQEDKTFKCYNIPDGKYTLSVVSGQVDNNKHAQGRFVIDKTFYTEEISISGNYKVDLNVDVSNAQGSETVYFGDLDRSNPKIFLKHTSSSEPVELITKLADEIRSNSSSKSSMDIICEIIKKMNSSQYSSTAPTDYTSKPTIEGIYKDGKLVYTSCGEYANVFVSFCRELGLPANFMQMTYIGEDYNAVKAYRKDKSTFVEAHMNVEVYLPDKDKWILVDPHFGCIIEDYDLNNPFIDSTKTPVNFDGIWYTYIRGANNTFSRPHQFVQDNIDITVPIVGQKYDKIVETK